MIPHMSLATPSIANDVRMCSQNIIFQGLLPAFSRVYSLFGTPFSRVKFTTVYSIFSEVYPILRLERESLRATSGEYALHALLSGGLAGDIWATLLVTSMCL